MCMYKCRCIILGYVTLFLNLVVFRFWHVALLGRLVLKHSSSISQLGGVQVLACSTVG